MYFRSLLHGMPEYGAYGPGVCSLCEVSQVLLSVHCV